MPHAYPFVSPVSHPGLAAVYVAEREAQSPHLAPEQLWSIPHVFARPVRLAERTPGGLWRVHGHDRLLTADVFTHPAARRCDDTLSALLSAGPPAASIKCRDDERFRILAILGSPGYPSAADTAADGSRVSIELSCGGLFTVRSSPQHGGTAQFQSIERAIDHYLDILLGTPNHAQPNITRAEFIEDLTHIRPSRTTREAVMAHARTRLTFGCSFVRTCPGGGRVTIEKRGSEYVVESYNQTGGGLTVRKPDIEGALRVFGDLATVGEADPSRAGRTYTTAGVVATVTLTQEERDVAGRMLHFLPQPPVPPRARERAYQSLVWERLMAAHGVKEGCAISRATRARIAADLDFTEPPLPSWMVPGVMLRLPASIDGDTWVVIRGLLPDAVVVGPAHNPMLSHNLIPNGIFLAQYGDQEPATLAPAPAGRVLANPGGIPIPEPACSDAEREETALLERRGLDLGLPRLVREDGHPEAILYYRVRLDVAETLAAWERAKRRVRQAIAADYGPFAKAREPAMVTWYEHMRTQDANAAPLVNAEDMHAFLVTYEKLRGGRSRPSEEAQKFGSLAPACVITTYERARSRR